MTEQELRKLIREELSMLNEGNEPTKMFDPSTVDGISDEIKKMVKFEDGYNSSFNYNEYRFKDGSGGFSFKWNHYRNKGGQIGVKEIQLNGKISIILTLNNFGKRLRVILKRTKQEPKRH